MSYILDALNKAEKERQLGNVPTLDSQHEAQGPAKKNIWLILALVAIVINVLLLFIVFKSMNNQSVAGYAIQKQNSVDSISAGKHLSVLTTPAPHAADRNPNATSMPEQKPTNTEPVQSTSAIQSVTNPMVEPAEMEAESTAVPKRLVNQPLSGPKHEQVEHTDQAKQDTMQDTKATQKPAAALAKSEETNAKAQELDTNSENIPLLAMKSPGFQQQIPHLNVDVHVYSEDLAKRFVLINLTKYRVGDEISTGLVLEEITVDGLVLNYNGERFRISRP